LLGLSPTTQLFLVTPLIAAFCDGKLYHEHIYWDQASVLVQIGLLDSTNLPVAGVEIANKLLDKNLPSNTLMKRWVESANKS
jgi:carboxymethylenebutenolidase